MFILKIKSERMSDSMGGGTKKFELIHSLIKAPSSVLEMWHYNKNPSNGRYSFYFFILQM